MRIGSLLTNEPNKRKDGFISGCMEFGLSYECLLLTHGMPASGFEDFLRSHMENGSLAFDGLFCGTDTVAYQVISMLRAMGLRVPEDVQVIGFDGIRMVRRLGLRLFHHRTARSRHRRSVCEHDSFP